MRMLFVVIAVASVAYCSYANRSTTTARPAVEAALYTDCAGLRDHLLGVVHPMKKIGNVECEPDRDGYTLTLIYDEAPSGMSQAETLSNAAAVSAVQYLVGTGINPKANGFFLSVHSQKREVGVSGQPVWRVYGYSYYDRNRDNVEFQPAK